MSSRLQAWWPDDADADTTIWRMDNSEAMTWTGEKGGWKGKVCWIIDLLTDSSGRSMYMYKYKRKKENCGGRVSCVVPPLLCKYLAVMEECNTGDALICAPWRSESSSSHDARRIGQSWGKGFQHQKYSLCMSEQCFLKSQTAEANLPHQNLKSRCSNLT